MNSILSLQRTTLNTPPEKDEIEVTLLGGGFGESVILHTGGGEWSIVDSCRFKGIQQPAGLYYLEQISVDYKNDVKTIIATHWDDDHIRGIGDVVTRCKNAKFIMSAALKNEKFIQIAVEPDSPLYQAITLGQEASTGISEFSKILHHLKGMEKHPGYALQDRCIWKSETQEDTAIVSLSPSDQFFEKAIHSIISQIPTSGGPKASIKGLKPNYTSVVLWVKVGNERLLLGADMEENPTYPGWTLIVENKISIDEKAGVYKVAHHGSSTGEHEKIWTQLLKAEPTALIAPWMRGGKVLPTEGDLTRISQKSKNVYLSSVPQSPKRAKSSEKHIRRAMEHIKAKPLLPNFGMIRLRKKIGTQKWQNECFGTACDMSREKNIP